MSTVASCGDSPTVGPDPPVATPRLPFRTSFGANCLADACALGAHAGQLGAAAISALAPSYFKPRDLGTLIATMAQIAAAAPATPFYYYDIPVMTGLSHSMPDFLAQAPARIPTLAGLKFTNPDLLSYQLILRADGGKWDAPFGVDEHLLGALAMGAQGAVGSGSLPRLQPFHLHRGDDPVGGRGAEMKIRLLERQPVMIIPTEPIGSIPGPHRLIEAVAAAGDATDENSSCFTTRPSRHHPTILGHRVAGHHRWRAAQEARRCLGKGAHKVQVGLNEGRLAVKIDPSGKLLHSFIDLNNLALSRFSAADRQRIGVHTCPGGDRDSTHSADVDYADLLRACLNSRRAISTSPWPVKKVRPASSRSSANT